jgi:hypothetical protein
VMLRGRLVVLRGFQVVFRALMFRHCHLLIIFVCRWERRRRYLVSYGTCAASGLRMSLRETWMTQTWHSRPRPS